MKARSEDGFAAHASQDTPSGSRLAAPLFAAAFCCLVLAGGVLWYGRGEAVFNAMMDVLAWCF